MSARLTTTPQLLVRSGFVICRATNSEGSSETMTWVGSLDTGERDNVLRGCLHVVLSLRAGLMILAALCEPFYGAPSLKFGHGLSQMGHIIMWMSGFIPISTSEKLHG